MSRSDRIVEIEIDDQRRLCVTPATAAFPLIYREAMDVGWDAENETALLRNSRGMELSTLVSAARRCGESAGR